jgi:hypothetical protein
LYIEWWQRKKSLPTDENQTRLSVRVKAFYQAVATVIYL